MDIQAAYRHYKPSFRPAVEKAVPYIGILYGNILVHELGHAAAAQALGLPVERIRVHLFGGECVLKRAVSLRKMALVSAAGPLAGIAGTISSLALYKTYSRQEKNSIDHHAACFLLQIQLMQFLPFTTKCSASDGYHIASYLKKTWDPRSAPLKGVNTLTMIAALFFSIEPISCALKKYSNY